MTKYPNDALHGSSCVLFHCELMPARRRKTKQKKNVSGDFSFYLSVFLWFGVSLMFGVLLLQVWLVVTEAQHAFHRQSHLCKWQNLNALLLPRAFVVYRRDSDAWKTRRTACKERERDCHKSVQGTKTGDPRTVHSVYITDSDICSQGQDVWHHLTADQRGHARRHIDGLSRRWLEKPKPDC